MRLSRNQQIAVALGFVVLALVAIVWSGTSWQEVLITAAGLLVVFIAIRVATGWGRSGTAGVRAQFTEPRKRPKSVYTVITLALVGVAMVLLVVSENVWVYVASLVLTTIGIAVLVTGRREAQAP